jgi:hypothetical protein
MYAFAEDRDAAIRAWAKGILPVMAGAELLIRSDWAERLDRGGLAGGQDNPPREYAYPKVGEFLQSAGYLSGGEYRQIVTIASFLGQLVRHSNDKEALADPVRDAAVRDAARCRPLVHPADRHGDPAGQRRLPEVARCLSPRRCGCTRRR